MNRYETTFILDAGVEQSFIDNEIKTVEGIITSNGGEVLEVERWGIKRFAYELKKRHQGNYIHIKFHGPGDIPDKLSRSYRFNENILRFLTVLSPEIGGLEGALRKAREEERAESRSRRDKSPDTREMRRPAGAAVGKDESGAEPESAAESASEHETEPNPVSEENDYEAEEPENEKES